MNLTDKVLTAVYVSKQVAELYGVENKDIWGRGRCAELAEARQTVMFLLWNIPGFTLQDIGTILGRTPTTVSHGFQHTAERSARCPETRNRLEILKDMVR